MQKNKKTDWTLIVVTLWIIYNIIAVVIPNLIKNGII